MSTTQYNPTGQTHVVGVVREPDRPRLEPTDDQQARTFKVNEHLEALLRMRDHDPERFYALDDQTKSLVWRYSRARRLAAQMREDELRHDLIELAVTRGTLPDWGRAIAEKRSALWTLEDRLTRARRGSEMYVSIPALEKAVEEARQKLEEVEAQAREGYETPHGAVEEVEE